MNVAAWPGSDGEQGGTKPGFTITPTEASALTEKLAVAARSSRRCSPICGVRLRLRAAVAETVAGDADIDAELRHLITALGGGAAGT